MLVRMLPSLPTLIASAIAAASSDASSLFRLREPHVGALSTPDHGRYRGVGKINRRHGLAGFYKRTIAALAMASSRAAKRAFMTLLV